MMEDELIADDLEESSSFEDALDDSEESNNTDSDQSLNIRQFWQGGKFKENELKSLYHAPIKPGVQRLMDISAKVVAKSFNFDQLEYYHKWAIFRISRIEWEKNHPVNQPKEQQDEFFRSMFEMQTRTAIADVLFLAIIRHSFPEDADNIALYSRLTSGSDMEFKCGEQVFRMNCVSNVVQIGYLISAQVSYSVYDGKSTGKTSYVPAYGSIYGPQGDDHVHHVTICVDRQRIISTSCTCGTPGKWCQHVIATCLERLCRPDRVQFRPTIWDSITELKVDQIKKLAQYFINALPRQYLPVAQQLIDELKDEKSELNRIYGAPDPTDGGHGEFPIWNFSVEATHKAISQILIKFVKPSPIVHCDVNMLNSDPQPPVANEYKIRRTVLKSRHPLPLWNGFNLICEMFKRRDENATMLLHMITIHCLSVDQIIIWWYQAKLLESGQWHMQLNPNKNNRVLQQNSFIKLLYDASELCDEIVRLWKIAALNPRLTDCEKEKLVWLLQLYHRTAVSRIWKTLNKPDSQYQMKMMVNSKGQFLSPKTAKFQKYFFPGFSAALEACQVNYRCSELRGIPLTVTQCSPPEKSNLIDCPNIPLLKMSQSDICEELEQAIHQVTTAVLFEDQIESSAEGAAGQRQRSRRKKKKRARNNNPSTSQRGAVVNQNSNNSGSGSTGGGDFSGGEESAMEDFEGNCNTPRERYQLELDEFFAQMHAEREPCHIRLDACDALIHHGYHSESIYMAIKLADESLKNRPNVEYDGDVYCNHLIECYSVVEDGPSTAANSTPKRAKRPMFSGVLLVRQIDSCPQKIEVQLPAPEPLKATKLAVETMERALKIMKILLSCPGEKFEVNRTIITQKRAHKLALEIGTAALSMPRKPAATHQLEVYLNYLDIEILEILRTVRLTAAHLQFLSKVAISVINRCQQSYTTTMPPLSLSLYLLEALTKNGRLAKDSGIPRTAEQEELALRAAILCLDMKPSYVEEDLPMNFECYRKLKRNLAVALFVQYKDNIYVLGLIVDKLLDPGVHKMHDDHESNAAFFFEKSSEYKQNFPDGKRPYFSKVSTTKESTPNDLESALDSLRIKTEELQETLYYTGPGSAIHDGIISSTPISDDKPQSSQRVTKPVTPHATEALALFYHDLATKINVEAGGMTPTHVFNTQGMNIGVRTNRNLQMCAFLIGLYSMGIYNSTVRNWGNRSNYGFNVGWLQNQALEIGRVALEYVQKIWLRHFTPAEISLLADKASHRADESVIFHGAMLGLIALRNAYGLTPAEIISRLRQCKETNAKLFEDALIAVETVANERGGISAEVLFMISKSWCDLCAEENREEHQMIPQNPQQMNPFPPQYPYYVAPPMVDQYQQQYVPPMYMGHPPPIPQYVAGPTAGLHPSHSAPNLLPQNQFQFRGDHRYPYFFNNAPPVYPNNYMHRNPQGYSRGPRQPVPLNSMHINGNPGLPPMRMRSYNVQQSQNNISPPQSASPYVSISANNDSRKMKLLNSYRVGILAMIVQRNHELEDRKLLEEQLNSPRYAEDIKTLMETCTQLGFYYLQSFYEHVAGCVSSPSLLYEYACKSMGFYATANLYSMVTYIEQMPIPASQQLFIPSLKYVTMFQSASASSSSYCGPQQKPHQHSSTFDMNNLAAQIHSSMVRDQHSEIAIKIVRKGVEMSYVALLCRLSYTRLQPIDGEYIKTVTKIVRDIFKLMPNGKNFYDSYIRYWKNQKSARKKINEDLKVRDLLDQVPFISPPPTPTPN